MRPTPKKILWAVAAIVLISLAILAYKNSQQIAPVSPIPAATQTPSPLHAVIGRSVQGRSIDAYTYLPLQPANVGQTTQASTSAMKHLLFVGGIHGGYEWNSVLLAYTFMDYLSANPDIIAQNETVTVIPDANPDAVYSVTGKEGRFAISDVSTSTTVLARGRFNADDVDLNRNFDCKWQPKGNWQNKTVSAGTAAFSEPEAQAIRDYIMSNHPDMALFWHSQSNGVFASQCQNGILPATLNIMNAYSQASGYPAIKTFDAYPTTGAADDWMASIGIPAITVELQTHSSIEWDRNLLGIKALLKYF